MNLKQYYNKQVKIVSKSGKVFWGTVNDYFYPEDNETGKESIAIDTPDGQLIGFDEDSIQEISVMP